MNEHDDSLRGRYLRWENDHTLTGVGDNEGPCPVCKATIRRVAPSMRYHTVHDYHEHQRKGVAHVGMPYKRSDAEMYRDYGSWQERRKQEREKAAKSKARSMRASAHNEPTEAEVRAKKAAQEYLQQQTSGSPA